MTVWMKLKYIMISDGRQIQQTTYCMIPCICSVYNKQISRDEGLPGPGGKAVAGTGSNWQKGFFGDGDNF